MAEGSARAEKLRSLIQGHELSATARDAELLKDIKIENCIGFTRVPLGIAGPLQLRGPDAAGSLFLDK
ncbi:3-hydroxy-3-methylglutaryl-coenzyme A reductase, partial [Diaporthe amygdali]|uniref:3-hydroxy-3-methylglutaryl-coenzyme A reductase n=1 Tax=Phomopsis amygdali TaxID=1214568 RepID=UPI0022FEF237